MQILSDFLEKSKIKYRKDEPASKHTTIAAGGILPFIIEPDSKEELSELFEFFLKNSIQYCVLGAGSNLIVDDEGLNYPAVRLGKGFRYYKQITEDHNLDSVSFEVGASMPLMSLSRELSAAGYSGLEFAGGIPASIGGAVRMNAGAHNEEMSFILSEINFINSKAEFCTVKKDQFNFSYRNSGLPADALVYRAVIKLNSGDAETISEKRRRCLEYRKNTQPLTLPSFGSVFKNPDIENAAGMLIEKCGLKGFAIGGASVSEMHANWIVNQDRKATVEDVFSLIGHIQKVVKEKTGFQLEEEVVYFFNK